MSNSDKSRGWCITINELHEMYFTILKSLPYRYLCIGGQEVAPSTGHLHNHAFIYFKNPRSFNSMKKKLGTCHIEAQRGTNYQAQQYTIKDSPAIFEDGEIPHQGAQTCNAEELKVMPTDELIETYGKNWQTFFNAKNMLNSRMKLKDLYKPNVEVIYIWGPSEYGKSLFAKRLISKKFGDDEYVDDIKHIDSFWHNVHSEGGVALYDDFRDSDLNASEFVRFIDYNRHALNIKGGSIINNYTYIVITSIQSPFEIYPNSSEPNHQWLRRMKLIEYTSEGPIRRYEDDYLNSI